MKYPFSVVTEVEYEPHGFKCFKTREEADKCFEEEKKTFPSRVVLLVEILNDSTV